MLLQLDKFREECGVVAIYGHPEASTLAYLGLHALQHRGQESAGMAACDGTQIRIHKAMGLVGDIFTAPVLEQLPGTNAIGHTRYSTTGDSAILNAQPIRVDCNKGMIAVAHNGNLVNAASIRGRLEADGSIFQTSSDTEVIVHLIAHSRECAMPEAIRHFRCEDHGLPERPRRTPRARLARQFVSAQRQSVSKWLAACRRW